jgi:hypothetical protein
MTLDKPSTVPTSPETIGRLQAGVAPALAMLAGMQLDIFTHLADQPLLADELATVLGVASDRLSRLLYALVVSGLLERQGDGFANAPEAAAPFWSKAVPATWAACMNYGASFGMLTY